MGRTIAISAACLALGAFALAWLEHRFMARSISSETYIAIIAAAFAGLGAWTMHHLMSRPARGDFERNIAAQRSLKMTEREYEVLALVASGRSNKEIARKLAVSPNTVKTHLSNLFAKLEVKNRTQAVDAARRLSLIP